MKKEEIKLLMSIIFQNIAITGLFIFLAVTFGKWWISLISLITYQSIKFTKGDNTKSQHEK